MKEFSSLLDVLLCDSQYCFTPGYLTCSVYFKLREELNVQEVEFEN